MGTTNLIGSLSTESLAESSQQGHAHHLQIRWQGIRLQEIRRQLSIMTDQSFFITTGTHIQCSKIIYIPEEALILPIEMLAAVAAWAWVQKMHHEQPHSSREENTEKLEFVGQFLSRFHYSLEKVVQFGLHPTHPELTKQFDIFSKHLLSLVLIYQNNNQRMAQAQRRMRIKKKPINLRASIDKST